MIRKRRGFLLLLVVLGSLASVVYGLRRFQGRDHIIVTITWAPGLPVLPKTVAQQNDWERFALRRLSEELKRHPSAKKITVRYGVGWAWGHWLEEDKQNTLDYWPGRKRLQGSWMGNCTGEWEPVTPEHLQRLAEMNGIRDDLTRFGCRKVCP